MWLRGMDYRWEEDRKRRARSTREPGVPAREVGRRAIEEVERLRKRIAVGVEVHGEAPEAVFEERGYVRVRARGLSVECRGVKLDAHELRRDCPAWFIISTKNTRCLV